MTNPAAGHAQATLSGRELALQRRQAMALRGKSAAKAAPAAYRAQRAEPVAASTASGGDARTGQACAVAMDTVAVAMNPARARRQALSLRGKAAVGAAATRPVAESSPPPVREAVQAAPSAACAGGSACSCGGGAAKPAATALPPVQLGQGRRAAMQRRQAQATAGAGKAPPAARPSGRVRPREQAAAAAKVEQGHTLSGQLVTGTQVERTVRVTGNEPGSCRAVTGTEYIGSEQFESLCATRPAPAAPKVLAGRTDRGQAFTGTLLDRPARVTGSEQGADRAVTGTRYLAPGVDNAPAKVELTHTANGRAVTGTNVDSARRATGTEAGGCRPVTGTEYLSSEHFRAVCATQPPAQPRKVSVMSSRDGECVTGSSVERSSRVTGNEAGSERAVTGNQYFNAKDFTSSLIAAARAGASLAEAGDRPKARGDERQGCTRVTASNRGSIQSRLAMPARAVASVGSQGMSIPARAVTGDRPGGGGAPTTGDERGACEPVTGTPYVGDDNRAAHCVAPADPAPASEPGGFSILTPGHAALGRERGRGITGNAMGTERITGPVNKAQGLITGTPEFRRPEPRQEPAEVQAAPRGANRLSGEGSQQGVRISGDVWMDRSRVTGTEGSSAHARNPSLRGQPRGTAGGAAAPRGDVERPQVPPSRVTGSSGNSERGAVVTVSGGARG